MKPRNPNVPDPKIAVTSAHQASQQAGAAMGSQTAVEALKREEVDRIELEAESAIAAWADVLDGVRHWHDEQPENKRNENKIKALKERNEQLSPHNA